MLKILKVWKGIAVDVGPPYGKVAIKRTIKNPKNRAEKRVGEAYSLSSYKYKVTGKSECKSYTRWKGRTQINPENGKFQFIPIDSELF